MKQILTLLILLSITACNSVNNTPVVGCGYVTCNDPIRHECIDNSLWVVNESGRYDLGTKCE